MKLIQLPIDGDKNVVKGTFKFAATLVGDAVIATAYTNPLRVPPLTATALDDSGDATMPMMEMQDVQLLGVTSTGRPVVAFRSGNRKPGTTEWDGTSSFFLGVGAASELREPTKSVVIEATQPGPPGAMGPRGPVGPQGPQGPAGEGNDLTEEEMQRLADLVALRVWTMPPPPELKNISGLDFGTLAQEVTSYPQTQRQDYWQLAAGRVNEAVANMKQYPEGE